jgi:Ni/Co efflux regulator RcnB
LFLTLHTGMFTNQTLEWSGLSFGCEVTRVSSDHAQVARIKDKVYKSTVDDLVKRYSQKSLGTFDNHVARHKSPNLSMGGYIVKRIGSHKNYALALLIAVTLAASAMAGGKPEWAGGGKEPKREKGRESDRDKGSARNVETRGAVVVSRFGDQHRVVIRDYYAGQFRTGRCPPGLAKKRNGCMPPGQAKKWRIGRPLPRDVVFYELPAGLVVEFGLPAPGHRYVRVAADILLIAIGTGMVIDAIEDLGRI